MKNFTKLFALLLLVSGSAFAQDIHFSQYYYSPLTMNPALTGSMDGTYRVGALYRNQWSSITNPYVYQTPAVYGDVALFQGSRDGSNLGLGAVVINDQQGSGALTTTEALGSLAWHQSLDGVGNYFLSVGVSGGLVQQQFDVTKLTFFDQFNGYDFLLPTGETLGQQASYMLMNAGMAFNGVISDHSRISMGFSAFNLNEPKVTYSNDNSNVLNRHYVAHAGGTIGIQNKYFLFPNIEYMIQNADDELVLGSGVGYNFSPSPRRIGTVWYGGLFARQGGETRDMIFTTGIINKGLQAGVAYDLNSGSLSAATGGNGGFEIAMIFTGAVKTIHRVKKQYCPRF